MVGRLFVNFLKAAPTVKGKHGPHKGAYGQSTSGVLQKKGFKGGSSKAGKGKPSDEGGSSALFKHFVAVESARLAGSGNAKAKPFELLGSAPFRSGQNEAVEDVPPEGKGKKLDAGLPVGVKFVPLGKKGFPGQKAYVSESLSDKKGGRAASDRGGADDFRITSLGHSPLPEKTGKGEAVVKRMLDRIESISQPSPGESKAAGKPEDVPEEEMGVFPEARSEVSLKNDTFEELKRVFGRGFSSSNFSEGSKVELSRIDVPHVAGKKRDAREGVIYTQYGKRHYSSKEPLTELFYALHSGKYREKPASRVHLKSTYGHSGTDGVHKAESSVHKSEKPSKKAELFLFKRKPSKSAVSVRKSSRASVFEEIVERLASISEKRVENEKSISFCRRAPGDSRTVENMRRMLSVLRASGSDKSGEVKDNFLKVYLERKASSSDVYVPKRTEEKAAADGFKGTERVRDGIVSAKDGAREGGKHAAGLPKHGKPLNAEVFVFRDSRENSASEVVDNSKRLPVDILMALRDEEAGAELTFRALGDGDKDVVGQSSLLKAEFGRWLAEADKVLAVKGAGVSGFKEGRDKSPSFKKASANSRSSGREVRSEGSSSVFERHSLFNKRPLLKEKPAGFQSAGEPENSLDRHLLADTPADDEKRLDSGPRLGRFEKVDSSVFSDGRRGNTARLFKREAEGGHLSQPDSRSVSFSADGAGVSSGASHRSNPAGETAKIPVNAPSDRLAEGESLTASASKVAFVVLDEKDLKGRIKILTKGDEHVKVIFNLSDSSASKIAAGLADLRNNLLKHGFQDVFVGLGGGGGEGKGGFSSGGKRAGVKEYGYKTAENSGLAGLSSESYSQEKLIPSGHINTLA